MLADIRQFATRLVRQVMRDDVMGLAAELSYRFFLALFPFAIFVAALGGLVAHALGVRNPAEQITTILAGALPSQAATILGAELERIVEHQEPGLLSFGAISALFFATAGTNAVLKGMNRAFEVEETRPFVRRYILALGLTLLAGSALVLSLLLFVAGELAGGSIATRLGLGGAAGSVVSLARWPLLVILLTAAVIVLYRFGPNVRAPMVWIVPCAAAFAIAWLVAMLAFTEFVSTIGSYGATYGALAGVAILLVWLYISSVILLIGVELVGVLTHVRRHAPVEAREPESEATGKTAKTA